MTSYLQSGSLLATYLWMDPPLGPMNAHHAGTSSWTYVGVMLLEGERMDGWKMPCVCRIHHKIHHNPHLVVLQSCLWEP